MKVTLEKKEKNQVELEVHVDAERVEKAYDRAYRQVSKEVRIPGFRPGKAPRPIVERTVGVDYIKHTAFEKFLLPEVYPAAIEEGKVEPISEPSVELVSFEKDQPLVFKATVEVRPEVKLGAYTGLEIGAPKAEVSDADVTERIDRLRDAKATLEVADRAAEMGDTVTADFTGTIDGVEFEGGKATQYPIEMATGRFIEGFVEALVGTKAGDEKAADLKFPEDYPNAELAGKAVTFTFKVHEVKARKRPELDETFAKAQGYDSVEAMTAKVREDLTTEREEAREIELRKQLIEAVVAGAEMEVPDTMIARESNFLLQQQANMLAQQGIDPNKVFTKENIDTWRENTRPEAEKRIRTSLTLGEVARTESIQPTEEEIEEAIAEYAANYGVDVAQFRAQVISNGAWPQIADEVLSNKIIEWLFERAKVSEAAPVAANA
ncbi:trigger factor [bacterium]|nr:trigger factor [bacterium]